VLFDTEFFGVSFEHKAFTRDKPNFQQASVAVESEARDIIDKGATFKYRTPYGRKIISISHQLSAQLREIARSL
jgi:hypothetical protein